MSKATTIEGRLDMLPLLNPLRVRLLMGLLFACGLARAQESATTDPGTIPTFGTTVVMSSGLKGDIYLLKPGTESLPRFGSRKPIGSVYTTSLNVTPRSFRDGFPGITDRFEWFAIDYKGRFWIEKTGEYRFLLNSDDGSKLYLDNKLMINNDGLHFTMGCEAAVFFSRGVHTLRVSYFQGPHDFLSLVLQVAQPGESWRTFDTREFSPAADAATDEDKKTKPVQKLKGGSCESP